MSQRERQRYHLLEMVVGGKIKLKETSKLMVVSYRGCETSEKEIYH